MIYITKVSYRKYRVGVDLYVAMDDKVKHNLQVGHAKSKTKAYQLAKLYGGTDEYIYAR
jgi:hypothetical protein